MSFLLSDFRARMKKHYYEKIVLEWNTCNLRSKKKKVNRGKGKKVWHICSQELLLTLSRANNKYARSIKVLFIF